MGHIRSGIISLAVALAAIHPAAAETRIKLGALMPMTGSLQAFGEPTLNAIKLAAEEINKAGGVLGGDVAIVAGDDQSSPQAGVDAAQKLVSLEKINGLLGALSSGVTIPVAKTVTSAAGIPQISGASTSPTITTLDDKDFLFRTIPSDAYQGLALAELAKEKGYKSVGIVYINNDYGQGLSEAFKEAFTKAGGSVTSQAAYEEGQASYRGQLQKAGQGKPEALVLIAYPGDGIPLVRQSLEGGFFQKFLFSDGMKAPEVVDAIGGQYLEGAAGTAPQPSSDSPAAKTFAAAYQAKYGQVPPKPFMDNFYDATYLFALAAEKAKSTDGKAIRDALRDVANPPGVKVGPGEFAKAKALIDKGEDIDYVGAAGDENFDKTGDVGGSFAHWEFKGGKVVTVRVFEPKI